MKAKAQFSERRVSVAPIYGWGDNMIESMFRNRRVRYVCK
jgi:hypothetical protein